MRSDRMPGSTVQLRIWPRCSVSHKPVSTLEQHTGGGCTTPILARAGSSLARPHNNHAPEIPPTNSEAAQTNAPVSRLRYAAPNEVCFGCLHVGSLQPLGGGSRG